MRLPVRSLVVAWFLLVLLLGANHKFVSPAGTPPLAVGLAFVVPVLLFLAAVGVSPGFRDYVLQINPIFLAALHGWRFIGLGFIMAYCEHLLDASFAYQPVSEISPPASSLPGSFCTWPRTAALFATRSSWPGTSLVSRTLSLPSRWARSIKAFFQAFNRPSSARSCNGCPSSSFRASLSHGCSSRTSSC